MGGRRLDLQILSLVLGILGNVIQILVFASPFPTFRQIIRRRSTESFSAVPYITTILSNALWLYYGLLKPNEALIASISAVGVCFGAFYVSMYLIFAIATQRVYVGKLLAFTGAFIGLVSFCTLRFAHGNQRIVVVGVFCAVNSACMYASPLSVVGLVIRTKSVKYMPFWLSFFLALSAFVWLAFALVNNDPFLMASNSIGSTFGILQLSLYAYYSRIDSGLEECCQHIDVEKKSVSGLKATDPELGLKGDHKAPT